MTDPRRVLLVSATIGEGHNATARAVEDAARRVWPGCDVSWVDALEAMGWWVPATFRRIYVTNVESTPWLYDWFYRALWRHRWFANSSRRFVGAWSGRRLRPLIAAHRPDLVVSTYPMGTAGLDWLRGRGELDVPVAAVVSDFSPHPFWVYSRIDVHYVMSGASLRELRRAEPSAEGAVCVPPVVPSFRPLEKADARRAFGLPEDGFVVLISCGSLGFGSVERAVDASLRVAGVSRVVVVCGRNEVLRRRFAEGSEPRLVALGWVDDMATLTASADVVVTNAGGATALEALACGRAVAMFEPIAGHGRPNAELMAQAGLAWMCPREDDLVSTLRRLTTEPDELAGAEQRALRHCRSGDFAEQVAALAHLPQRRGGSVLRAQDAFFVYATTPVVAQQTGAILRVEGVRSEMSTSAWVEHLSELIRQRTPDLPMLHRRLVLRGRRRPLWMPSKVEAADHLRHREIHTHQWSEVVHDFFSTPVPGDRPPWELLLVRDVEANQTYFLAKLHHALGDGLAVTNTLLRLLRNTGQHEATLQSPPAPELRELSTFQWWRYGAEVLRGLVSLAGAGQAPASGLEGASTRGRLFGWAELPSTKVRASARAHQVSSTVFILAVVAEALHRLLEETTGTTPGQRFRVMVPRTTRISQGPGRTEDFGNRTVTVAVDLPVGPMPPSRRITEVVARFAAAQRGGQPAAAGVVLAALGLLPAPLHSWVVRRTYRRRFFNAVVSVMPGLRRPPRVADAEIVSVHPVLPLADGVGIAIGALSWGETVGFGITVDSGLVPGGDELANHVRAAFDDLQEVGDGREGDHR